MSWFVEEEDGGQVRSLLQSQSMMLPVDQCLSMIPVAVKIYQMRRKGKQSIASVVVARCRIICYPKMALNGIERDALLFPGRVARWTTPSSVGCTWSKSTRARCASLNAMSETRPSRSQTRTLSLLWSTLAPRSAFLLSTSSTRAKRRSSSKRYPII